MNLYITQDEIGAKGGGGTVTLHEYRALAELGSDIHPIDGRQMALSGRSPFLADTILSDQMKVNAELRGANIAHFYAGSFSKTVATLKDTGGIVTYTAAAHNPKESRIEFESLGMMYDFPHLIDSDLWLKYVEGYQKADVVICPSQASAELMRGFGCKDVRVIPHGVDIPEEVPPMPKQFTIGYLGQAGPDKGLRYLFEAWKNLSLSNAKLLIAGNNTEPALELWRRFGGGQVEFMGFVPDIADFFARISVYVQPSVTEGFGIEVLEAMAYGRPVIVSKGAGACDVVTHEAHGFLVPPRDPHRIRSYIEKFMEFSPVSLKHFGDAARARAEAYRWDEIRKQYVALWRRIEADRAAAPKVPSSPCCWIDRGMERLPGVTHWSRMHEYPWAMRIAELKRTDRVLDAGGGDGFFAFQISDHVHGVTVFDQDISAIGKGPCPDNVTPVQGDIRLLPQKDGTFDKVFCISVLEHMAAPELAIEEMLRVLKPGGKLILTFDVADMIDAHNSIDHPRARAIAARLGVSYPELKASTLGYDMNHGSYSVILRALCICVTKGAQP